MKNLPFVIGAVMLVMGGVFTLQGLGYLEGSAMTDVELWAILGPLIAGFGVSLMIVGAQKRR